MVGQFWFFLSLDLLFFQFQLFQKLSQILLLLQVKILSQQYSFLFVFQLS